MMKTAIVGLLYVVVACAKPADAPVTGAAPVAAPATAAHPAKDPALARKLIAEGAVVIDVRTVEEYRKEHLVQASNIPVAEFASRIGEVDKLVGGDKRKPVVVYCGSGHRAATAKAHLEAAGYNNVVNGAGYDDLR